MAEILPIRRKTLSNQSINQNAHLMYRKHGNTCIIYCTCDKLMPSTSLSDEIDFGWYSLCCIVFIHCCHCDLSSTESHVDECASVSSFWCVWQFYSEFAQTSAANVGSVCWFPFIWSVNGKDNSCLVSISHRVFSFYLRYTYFYWLTDRNVHIEVITTSFTYIC